MGRTLGTRSVPICTRMDAGVRTRSASRSDVNALASDRASRAALPLCVCAGRPSFPFAHHIRPSCVSRLLAQCVEHPEQSPIVTFHRQSCHGLKIRRLPLDAVHSHYGPPQYQSQQLQSASKHHRWLCGPEHLRQSFRPWKFSNANAVWLAREKAFLRRLQAEEDSLRPYR